jgi:pyridoxal phosphate phosphatase PHOSPHO2
MMGELHSQGRSIEEIAGSMRTAPLPPHVVSAIETAHALGCELRILSDANAFFIDAVLAHHGLAGYFSEVSTNPAHVDAAGRLRISPHHDFHHGSSHGCTLATCPPNMCKVTGTPTRTHVNLFIEFTRLNWCCNIQGKVMEGILQELSTEAGKRRRRRVVYLGDGRGDYCPTLKLAERDYMMPRKGYPVWDLIIADRLAVRSDVRGWADAEDLETVLLDIIHECAAAVELEEDGGHQVVVPPECRARPLASAPELAMAVLPKAVQAPN